MVEVVAFGVVVVISGAVVASGGVVASGVVVSGAVVLSVSGKVALSCFEVVSFKGASLSSSEVVADSSIPEEVKLSGAPLNKDSVISAALSSTFGKVSSFAAKAASDEITMGKSRATSKEIVVILFCFMKSFRSFDCKFLFYVKVSLLLT